MKRAALLLCAGLLAGCTTGPGTQRATVSSARLAAAIVPGQTTGAALLQAFGPATQVAFASGYQVWRYSSPAAGGGLAEFVILIDPAGVVVKTRQRAPDGR
jgi:hypothetical protein